MRWLFGVPLFLQRVGLGGWERILGIRFIKITSKGRRTGRPHAVLVDILEHDLVRNTYYVQSAYGERADWVRNIKTNPVFEAQVGRTRFCASAERIPQSQAADVLLRYIDTHKRYAKIMMQAIGVDLDSFTRDELRARLKDELVLAIKPQKLAS
jgi:deazaflavin-dependent oxidoreductase (nitroreductase family)